MASTNDLDRLKKSAQGIQATNDTSSESFSRDRVIRAEEVKTGLSRLNGSWASEYRVEDATDTSSELTIRTGLGQAGVGDIDFIPYTENTNRIGVKGASSLGSPISFEILGATLKSPLVDWTWTLDHTGNTLTINHVSKTILTEYGIGQASDNPEVISLEDLEADHGGLYIVVNYVGNSYEKWASTWTPPTYVARDDIHRAQDQIFRVESMTSTEITLSSRTPLSDWFDSGGDVAGIMFLRKKASRMLEAPQSEGTTFFVMPPETSASLDFEPPLSNWKAGDFHTEATVGTASNYGLRNQIAVPTELTHSEGKLVGKLVGTPTSASEFKVSIYPEGSSAPSQGAQVITSYGVSFLIGKCLRITEVGGGGELTDAQRNAFYGYHEIIDIVGGGAPYVITLRRVSEQNLSTGKVTWDAGYAFDVNVTFTLHNTISNLVSSAVAQKVEIESARVKALISPSTTSINETGTLIESSLGRGGNSSWDSSEPSNLLDLGFGVVVYPAKISSDTNSLVADYDNPLSPNLYEVDYEGATVYLKSAYSQSSSVTSHATNPSGKTVLFISCVALSQEASFGVRLTTVDEGIKKGAYLLPKIPQIMSFDDLLDISVVDHSTFWDGTNSIFIPSLSVDQIPQTGRIEADILDTFSFPETNKTLGFIYKGVSAHNNGIKLDNVKVDFDPSLYGIKIESTTTFRFSRHSRLSFRQSALAGRSARSESITFNDGGLSYNPDGSISLSISGLRTDESTLLYDSSTRKWTVDSSRYEVGLELKRGDLVASNVTELPADEMTVAPVVFLSTRNTDQDQVTNDSHMITLSVPSFENLGDGVPDYSGFYLNVEGGAILSKKVTSFPNGERIILGLDSANTPSNPWQSKFLAYKNDTGSNLVDDQLVDALNTALKDTYVETYPTVRDYFYRSNSGQMMIAGRSPSVFPSYSYVSTANIPLIVEGLSQGNFAVAPKLPAHRYLLSLEEVGGGKWVTVAVPVAQTDLLHSLSGMSGDYAKTLDNAKVICEALNEDLYFGHSARLLNRAGFYEGFHQDYDSGTGNVTLNPSLQAKISAYGNHTIYGERQVLWITNDDPRHSNNGSAVWTDITIELICTGRGCGKIPFIEGGISGDNLKDEASKVENQLINVIASLGRAEQATGSTLYTLLFDGQDHIDYNRIGLYWESSTLPDTLTAQVKSVDAQAQANTTELGFDRNGFLPIGPWIGSSRKVYSQSYTHPSLSLSLLDGIYDGNERDSGSPIRNRISPDYYTNDGTGYFDLLPFLDATGGQKNVGESFDFLAQDHWLDNPHFGFSSEDDLTEEELGLYTWVSRDYVYPTSTNVQESTYLGLICTFSVNKRERSSFLEPLMSNTQTGYEDMIVSVSSDYFSRDLYSPNVIELGDDIYLNADVSGTPRVAKAKVTWRSENTVGKYEYQASLKAVNGQYGGFSALSYYQPIFEHHHGNTKFHATFTETTGGNLTSASVVGGNSFFWTQGNLRSLLTTASVPTQLGYSEFAENRDAGAIDGGFGTFGTQSASLLSGGRLGLFNGLPQSHAGISFASISGGLGTSGYRGGQDIGQYGNDELRVFETFLEHGVFSYVSLPLGTGGSFSSTIGHTTREKGKKSDYSSAVFGGNSGLRVSGDINLFIRNMRILGSDDNTAFVMHTDYAPPTNTDFLISNADVTLDVTSAFLPYNQTGTGPTTSGLQSQKSAQGFTNLSLKSQGGAHMPSGAGLFGPVTSPAITDVSVRRTATISLGLTLADLKGISKSLGREVSEPVGSTERQPTANFPNQYGTEADIGSAIFHMAQFSSSEIPTMALPSLRDAYVALMRYKHTDGSDVNHDDNWGIYKIIDTPILMPVDASDLESGQGTRNTLHGYGSDYTTHTRSSLNTIVANIMVRVESDEIRSIYPDQSAPNQGANALTPSELVIDSTYYENSLLSKPTAKLGHSWRVLKRSAGNYYHDVVVFDVVDQGGSPSGAPSDLHGLEVNPRALGRDSFPAEIVPLGYSDNHNADMPLSLELAPMDYFDSEETLRSNTLGLRLLGVHRNMDHRGKTSSLAFVTSYQTTYQGEALSREPVSFVDSLRTRIGDFIGDSPARLAVYSSERSDRLDESASSTTKQLFENGESGYVSLGYPERFGLGVVLDGGLGVVSGNAVRVHPQKGNFDSLGSLSIYSSPLMDSRLDLRDGNAVSLPSRFNRAEFYGDVVVAGHDSDLVIDDARTADGAFARKNEADLSASTTQNYQSRLLSFGEKWSAFGEWSGGNNSQGYIALIQDSIPNSYGTGSLPSYFLNAPPPPLPSDTILPWSKTGIRVKTGGTVVYERAFRPQDATGADIVASMAKGAKSDRGLRGLEIPTYGECMLLPKGPSTLGGRVFERDNSFSDELTSIGYGSKTKIRTGISPTDLPLYEFYNGPSRFAYGGNFAVTLGNVMQEHGVFERETASSRYFPISHSPKTNAGGGLSDRIDEFDAGVLSQAYHHSRSNESATWGGQSVLFDNPSDTRTIYVYAYYNNSSANSDEGFAVFYLDYNKRKVFVEIDTATYSATATAPIEQKVDPIGNGRPFVKASNSANLPAGGGTWNAGGSFDLPSYVDKFYVVTSANVADTGSPDLSVLFFRLSSINTALYGFSLGFSTSYSPSTPYLDLYPDVQSGLSQIDDNRYVNKIDYPVGLPDWGVNNTYDYDFNLTQNDLISEGFSATQRSDVLESPDDPMTSNMQVRLLDGMVLEDVTTGTFYTVGDVGRYRGWHSHLKPISQPGDVVKYGHNNLYFSEYDELDSNPNLSFSRAPIRKMTAGSAIGNNGNTSPEVFYDLSGHFDYEQDCLDRNDASSQKNGFGDISDNGYVRRPLLGHKFRVVPNVEFVPVLGHRSVKGGLAVPFDKATSYTTYIEEADAIFYDRDYSFLESDIGRKIYVCGTYEYSYVGWYVIIDIQKDYLVNPYTGISSANLDLFDVAVVRKIKRSGEYIRDWKSGDSSALPMRPRNMILEACLDASSNGKRIYLDDAEKDYDIHVADPFFPASSELTQSFVASYSGATVSGRADQNLVGYEPTSPLWIGVNLWAEDGSNRFFGVVADHSVLDPVTSMINEGSTDLLVRFLNEKSNFNGVRIGRSLKAYNQANSATYTGWGSYADAKWIKWKVKYAVPDYNARFPVLGSKGFVVCGITCEIDTSVLTELQRKNVVNRGCFLQVDLQFHPQIDSTTHISTDKTALSHDRESRGFFRLSGVNSNISVSWADKNSYYPNQYEGYSTDATVSAFNYDVYVLDQNDPTYVMTPRTFDLADETLYTKSQSASGGIRWVFSAPLLEENVGSYVHLTKPRPYRFGQPTYTQNERLQNDLPSTYTNPFAWASGWQRKKDLQNNDPFDLGTDIFRVNRCPSTGDILLGGDCESYAVEDIICRTRGGFTQKGIEVSYAPLSVMGNWPDSETNELPDTGSLNFPILYALQPVARERIVTIKPSSANSSVVMAHGQYGIAPMVVPASPLALDTTGAINTRFTDPLNFRVSDVDGFLIQDSDPLTTPGVNVPTVSIASTLDNDWGDYVFGERIMMDVSRPWLLMGRENASQSYRYFGTVQGSGLTNSKTGNPFIHATNDGDQLAWNPHTEGGNTESKRSYDKYSDNSDTMVNAIYTWSPSGEWWQIQTPLYIGFKSAFIDETTPPPTLRIDLTDSFTQSSSVGSGINSPYLGRTPKGSRLTRMWVNFGLNGDFADLPGALFDTNSKEHYNSVGVGRYDTLDNTSTRTERISQAEDPSDYEFYKRKATNSAMTFNLVVEIPGSIGNSEDTFFMDRSDNSTDDWSDLVNQEYSFSSVGGGNGSVFGGRAPTSSYNHSSNSTRYSIVDGVSALRGKPRFSGGTIIVPLYVNREAGDLMPNVMERFVTVGPVRFKRDGGAVSDWSVGDAYTGFGAKGNTVSSFQYPESLSSAGSVNGHIRSTTTENHIYSDFDVNSFSPIVWGGQNFYSSNTTLTNWLGQNGVNITLPDLATFEDVRSASVLASPMPRSSRTGGGVLSSFSSGLFSDSGIFSPENTNYELALHHSASTGITIAHSSISIDGFINEEDFQGGNFGVTDANTLRQSPKSSPHSFTIALTPVGDAFEAPSSPISMPKLSAGSLYANTLYTDVSGRQFASLGRYGRSLEVSRGTDPKDRRFKVGNWLDKILEYYGIPAQSGSMLPVGARVYLEATVPWSSRPFVGGLSSFSNNGAWISSVKCAFEVETADGTAWTLDVNTMGED